MAILFGVICRGTVILAKYATCSGNFIDVTNVVTALIPWDRDDKLTYTHEDYLIHYICERGVIYLCITDNEFERSRAFLFLNEIKRRFLASYRDDIETALPYAMNLEFERVLVNEIKHYSESHDIDTISKVHGELAELKDIIVKNIDDMSTRGERLELLANKADNLNTGSVSFRKTTRHLARSLFWKNVKLYVIIGIVITVITYFIVCMACGGLLWQGCVAKK